MAQDTSASTSALPGFNGRFAATGHPIGRGQRSRAEGCSFEIVEVEASIDAGLLGHPLGTVAKLNRTLFEPKKSR